MFLEGAGADPSQRSGTRLGGVVSSRDCRLFGLFRSHNTVDPVLPGRNTLTVSDGDTFTRAGGMVRFVTENGKIRLRINLAAAKACDLTISSKILRPATIVTAGSD